MAFPKPGLWLGNIQASQAMAQVEVAESRLNPLNNMSGENAQHTLAWKGRRGTGCGEAKGLTDLKIYQEHSAQIDMKRWKGNVLVQPLLIAGFIYVRVHLLPPLLVGPEDVIVEVGPEVVVHVLFQSVSLALITQLSLRFNPLTVRAEEHDNERCGCSGSFVIGLREFVPEKAGFIGLEILLLKPSKYPYIRVNSCGFQFSSQFPSHCKILPFLDIFANHKKAERTISTLKKRGLPEKAEVVCGKIEPEHRFKFEV
ncbi:hypothetical protein C8J57DRAFT_1235493 [Mycena rebaudengoi]|nr:hypothetical protein C8J57DRAFT_1235493 [Mycena rebaudengoi]